MVAPGIANSRMKDFFDIRILAPAYSFEMEPLVRERRSTFERRRTELPPGRPFALTTGWLEDALKQTQRRAFFRDCARPGASARCRRLAESSRVSSAGD
jgi:hypothetical protein